jgi:prepilin-type N-terminal cleavage/methylation domain-containing protein
MKSQQSGFTLVEIAIVLVIIGLLLGGILKGQELINSARVKNLANDFRVIPTYIYAYQDKYRALPGDQLAAQLDNQFPPNGTATPGSGPLGNGVINGAWNAASPAEAYVFWQHVRLANLAAGPTVLNDPNYTPRNAVGGVLGVQSGAAITGMTGTYSVCSAGVLGRYAKQLDTQMDDGVANTGSMRATETDAAGTFPAAAATGTLADDTSYTVCMMF